MTKKRYKNKIISRILTLVILFTNIGIGEIFASSKEFYGKDSIQVAGKEYGYNVKKANSKDKEITLIVKGSTYTVKAQKNSKNYNKAVDIAKCFKSRFDDYKKSRDNSIKGTIEKKLKETPSVKLTEKNIKYIVTAINKGVDNKTAQKIVVKSIIDHFKDQFGGKPLELLEVIVTSAFSVAFSITSNLNAGYMKDLYYDLKNLDLKPIKVKSVTSKIYTTTNKIVVKTDKYVSGTITIFSDKTYRNIAQSRINSSGETTIKIPKQKKGTVLTITVSDSSNNKTDNIKRTVIKK